MPIDLILVSGQYHGKYKMNITVVNQSGHELDFDAAVQLMDDDIREILANSGHHFTEQEFFAAYEKAHEIQFGELWELSKPNSVW
jgi:hypothetical protein